MADAAGIPTERLRALALWSEGVSERARHESTKRHEADVAACIRAVIAVRELCDAKESQAAKLAVWYEDPDHADAEDRPTWIKAHVTLRREASELRALVGGGAGGGR